MKTSKSPGLKLLRPARTSFLGGLLLVVSAAVFGLATPTPVVTVVMLLALVGLILITAGLAWALIIATKSHKPKPALKGYTGKDYSFDATWTEALLYLIFMR